MRRFMVMLVAVVLGASLMAPAVAAAGPRGDAVVRTTAASEVVPLYKCYTLDKTTAQLKAMPPGAAWLYLVALGWKGTLEEFFALSFWQRCQFYLASIPPAAPR